jgi:phosphate starvation-inducible PhoH-like protein
VGKQLDRRKSRNSRQHGDAEIIEFKGNKFKNDRILPPIKALNPTQAQYLAVLKSSQQIVVLGPAGTGKTWIAATHAADLFRTARSAFSRARFRKNSRPGRFRSRMRSRSASATPPSTSR